MLASFALLSAAAGVVYNDSTRPPDVNGMLTTLRAFEDAAKANGNSRSIAKGYNDSAAYVLSQLEQYSDVFSIEKQYFTVPVSTIVEEPELSLLGTDPAIKPVRCNAGTGWQHYETGCEFAAVRYGGNTNGRLEVTAKVEYVASPCTKEGWFTYTPGTVAMFEYPSACTTFEAVTLAQAAKAAAVLLANTDGKMGVPGGRVFDSSTWKLGVELPSIPTLGVSASIKNAILQRAHPLAVHMVVNNEIKLHRTFNIIATTRLGNLDKVVMVGSHLDSVPEGPGINDNGSGSSLVLQVALEFAQKKKVRSTSPHALRFAWWGAEEIGLMGSRFYVDELVENFPGELAKLAGYFNFDMEAGPNYVRMVYDGATAPEPAQTGSQELQHLFEDAWEALEKPYALTVMGGGSDFLPFILAGVPASGLATGAGGLKTDAERTQQGGIANTPLDPCYHAPCDTVENINKDCLADCGAALSHVLNRLLDPNQKGVSVHASRKAHMMDTAALQAKYEQARGAAHAGFAMNCNSNEEL
eukprot:TRINITY_DN7973_c0_g1_i1.p2 TRINITY_DN7973_c0_g1~~TRINITY_DN7973_c0_g1_i1.p2  ORF type:complete len:544 (+),score=235.63 TRINITY_DN7973_c0_g1_i1:57-1634(+)